jgi:hydroxymethylbilane synthase
VNETSGVEPPMNLRIGSRGSQLALWQANHIAALLRGQGHSVEIEIIKTTGDRLQEVTFAQVGSKGMFTKEIEEALAEGRVDLAVHSLKDLPTELPEPFALAATPPRVDPRDVFVSVKYESLAELPQGARVGTSSQRRRAQLKALRPDIEAVEFRGNVDTRLRKLAEGQVEAILLAAAGLDRLEKTEWVRERLEPKDFCPAAGQGALGIETRKDDAATIAAVAFLDDAATRFAVTAERAALAALGGGCQVPIGIHCRPWQQEDSARMSWIGTKSLPSSPLRKRVRPCASIIVRSCWRGPGGAGPTDGAKADRGGSGAAACGSRRLA